MQKTIASNPSPVTNDTPTSVPTGFPVRHSHDDLTRMAPHNKSAPVPVKPGHRNRADDALHTPAPKC